MSDHRIDQALISATSTTQAIFNGCKRSQPGSRFLQVEPIWTTPPHPVFSIFLLSARNPDNCPGPTVLDDHGSIARFENSQLEAFVVHSVPTCLQQLLLMDFYLTVHTLDQLPEKLSTEKEPSLERTCRGQGFLYLVDATRPIELKQFME